MPAPSNQGYELRSRSSPVSQQPTVTTAEVSAPVSQATTSAPVQAIITQSATMPTGIQLEKYDGKSSASQWWSFFMSWSLLQNMTEERQCAAFGFQMDPGIPRNWYVSLTNTIKESLDQLKAAFLDRFGKKSDYFDVDVLQLKQRTTEKVEDFLLRLDQALAACNVPENIKIGIAIKGFKGEIGKTVHNTFPKPTTLEEVRRIALNAEKSETLNQSTSDITMASLHSMIDTKMQEHMSEITKRLETSLAVMEKPKHSNTNRGRFQHRGQQHFQPQQQPYQMPQHQPMMTIPQNNQMMMPTHQYQMPQQQYQMPTPVQQNNPMNFQNDGQAIRNTRQQPGSCMNCGMFCGSNCPARSKTCYKCNTLGHIARCCKSSRRQNFH